MPRRTKPRLCSSSLHCDLRSLCSCVGVGAHAFVPASSFSFVVLGRLSIFSTARSSLVLLVNMARAQHKTKSTFIHGASTSLTYQVMHTPECMFIQIKCYLLAFPGTAVYATGFIFVRLQDVKRKAKEVEVILMRSRNHACTTV